VQADEHSLPIAPSHGVRAPTPVCPCLCLAAQKNSQQQVKVRISAPSAARLAPVVKKEADSDSESGVRVLCCGGGVVALCCDCGAALLAAACIGEGGGGEAACHAVWLVPYAVCVLLLMLLLCVPLSASRPVLCRL
jgi:hypothetical protein